MLLLVTLNVNVTLFQKIPGGAKYTVHSVLPTCQIHLQTILYRDLCSISLFLSSLVVSVEPLATQMLLQVGKIFKIYGCEVRRVGLVFKSLKSQYVDFHLSLHGRVTRGIGLVK